MKFWGASQRQDIDPLTRATFIGVCTDTPRLAERRPGHVLPLTGIVEAKPGAWTVDAGVDLSMLGPSNSVFWPPIYPDVTDSFDRCLVRFALDQNPNHFRSSDESKDWYQVACQQGAWRIERFGWLLVDQRAVGWRSTDRAAAGLPHGASVYLVDVSRSTLFGPWTVRHGRLDPPDKDYVLEFPLAQIEPGSRVDRPARALGAFPHSVLGFLLAEPDEDLGAPLDIATPKRKAEWLRERLQEEAAAILEEFDRTHPGWRRKLEQRLEELEDPLRAVVWKKRCESLDELLGVLSVEDLQDTIEVHPRIRDEVQEEIGRRFETAVKERAEELEAKARELSRACAEEEAGRRRDLEAQTNALRDTLRKLEAELEQRRAEVEGQEERLLGAAARLEESRARIVEDFVAFQSLLGAPQIGGAPRALGTASVSMKRTLDGNPITESERFVDERLVPAFTLWSPGLHCRKVECFHYALLGTRWVLVPGPEWGRAYVDALGGTGHLHLVAVDPAWLRFEDAWDEGIGDAWRAAIDDPDGLYVVGLSGINRALPQCWARPLLDCLAGLVDVVRPRDNFGWPENLRVISWLAEDEAVLPVPGEVFGHWSAVAPGEPQPVENGSAASDGMLDSSGHVLARDWLAWAGPLPKVSSIRREAKPLGRLAVAASRDLSRLEQIIERCQPSLDEESRQSFAERIRIDWPAEYASRARPKDD